MTTRYHPVALLLVVLSCSPRPEPPPTHSALDSVDELAADTLSGPEHGQPTALDQRDRPSMSGTALILITTSDGVAANFTPIYFLTEDREVWSPSMTDTGVAPYRAVYARPDRRYLVLEGGNPVGRLSPTGMEPYGCGGVEGYGTILPRRDRGWTGLATTDTTLRTRWRRRDLTPAERVELTRLARPLLLELEANPAGADSAVVARGFAFERDSAATLVAAALTRDEPRRGGYHERLSVFLIAEQSDSGLSPTHTWRHGGIEESRQQRFFIDALDLDQDGQLEFVTSVTYYESQEFEILTATGVPVYRGGGGGC